MSNVRKSWIGVWLFLAITSFIWGNQGAWLACVMVALLGLMGLSASNRDREIAARSDFSPRYKFARKKRYLALDPTSRKIALWSGRGVRFFDGTDIVDIGVDKDGQAFSTSEHSMNISVLGGAIGALVAGPAGLLLGGVSGASSVSRQHEAVSRLGLSVIVNDPADPVFEMQFFASSKPVPAGSAQVKRAAKDMGLWLARLRSISHR
jgi:hypothetical protein